MEDEQLDDEEKHPIVRGRGSINEALAVCEMIALHQSSI